MGWQDVWQIIQTNSPSTSKMDGQFFPLHGPQHKSASKIGFVDLPADAKVMGIVFYLWPNQINSNQALWFKAIAELFVSDVLAL